MRHHGDGPATGRGRTFALLLAGFLALVPAGQAAAQSHSAWSETLHYRMRNANVHATHARSGTFALAGDVHGCAQRDGWVVKLAPDGQPLWQKTYGFERGTEELHAITARPDGGLVVAGYTNACGAGGKDFWVVSLLTNGDLHWQHTYGGPLDDVAHAIAYVPAVPDLGDVLIVAGETSSFGSGGKDFWILVLDPETGDIKLNPDPQNPHPLQIAFGGVGDEIAWTILPIDPVEKDILVAGETSSPSLSAGGVDCWVLRLARVLTTEWEFAYGGSYGHERCFASSLAPGQFPPGSEDIILGGEENGLHFPPGFDTNMWVLRIDHLGGVLWERTYGGARDERATSIARRQLPPHLAVAGWRSSPGCCGKWFRTGKSPRWSDQAL